MVFIYDDDDFEPSYERGHYSSFQQRYDRPAPANTPRRRVFYSFHFRTDAWRAAQVRYMNLTEHDAPLSNNDWEQVRRGGEAAIQKWIDRQMHGKSCVIVLIGEDTASRPWVRYEIEKAWTDGKGVVGIYIHNLRNREGLQARKGDNPLRNLRLGRHRLSEIVPTYDPQGFDSKDVYATIQNGMVDWVEKAIRIRQVYPIAGRAGRF